MITRILRPTGEIRRSSQAREVRRLDSSTGSGAGKATPRWSHLSRLWK